MILTFENFEYNPQEWLEQASEILTSVLGNSYFGSNADWGDMELWKLQDNKFEGYFVVIDDENNIILLKREWDEETEEYNDVDLVYVSFGEDITKIIDFLNNDEKLKYIMRLRNIRKFNL